MDRHNSCDTFWGPLKGKHFNGEPFINVGDTIANTIPGVNSTVSTGGTGEVLGSAGMSRFLGPPLTDDEREIVL